MASASTEQDQATIIIKRSKKREENELLNSKCSISCFFNWPYYIGWIFVLVTLILSIFWVPLKGLRYTIQCYSNHLHAIIMIRNLFSSFLLVAIGLAAYYGYSDITKHLGKMNENMVLSVPVPGENTELIPLDEIKTDKSETKKIKLPSKREIAEFVFLQVMTSVPVLLIFTVSLTVGIIFSNDAVRDSFWNTKTESVMVLITAMLHAGIKIYHYQLFWIIGFTIVRNIANKLEPIVETIENKAKIYENNKSLEISDEDEKFVNGNLLEMMNECTKIFQTVIIIDSKICWFILFVIVESICATGVPIIQFLFFVNHNKNNWLISVVYVIWILIRVVIFSLYSFILSLRISGSYSEYVNRYKHAIYSFLVDPNNAELRSNFKFGRKELFDKYPSFTIGGIVKMREAALVLIMGLKFLATVENLKRYRDHIFSTFILDEVSDYYYIACDRSIMSNHTQSSIMN